MYLLYFLIAVFAVFLLSRKLVVYGDAAYLTANACYVAVTLLLYEMFKPVNERVSLLAALLSVIGCFVQTLGLFHLAPLHISPFAFFGPYCLLIGYLIFNSTFLPRVLGVLMMLAGLGWLLFLSPPLSHALSSYIKVVGFLAEASLMVWLLAIGVDVSKWESKVKATL